MNDEGRLEPFDEFFAEFGLDSYDRGLHGKYDNPKSSSNPRLDMFAADMWDVIDRMGNLLISKQEDYGPLNISRAPGGPLNGLRVRIYDKIARINNLIDSGEDPKHESLYDSFLDLANYGVIAMMVLDGSWPDTEDI
jgi:hypothetical protein